MQLIFSTHPLSSHVYLLLPANVSGWRGDKGVRSAPTTKSKQNPKKGGGAPWRPARFFYRYIFYSYERSRGKESRYPNEELIASGTAWRPSRMSIASSR